MMMVMMVIAWCKLGATLRPASLADGQSLDLGTSSVLQGRKQSVDWGLG